jgi:chromosome segregation ATPase
MRGHRKMASSRRIALRRLQASPATTHEDCLMIPLKPTLTAGSLLLGFAVSLAVAQTAPVKPAAKPAAKTLGGKSSGSGKLMTRDELRACLKRLDDLNQSVKDLEAMRPTLDRERDELKAAGEALKSERAELDRQLIPVREWEGKVRAQTADIEAFNKRNDALAEAPRNQQPKLVQELKVERDRLEQVRESLVTEEAKLVPVYKANVAAHNERVTARDAKVTDWNARNTAAVDTSAKHQEARALWLNECANRPYFEDDEKAIKAGK